MSLARKPHRCGWVAVWLAMVLSIGGMAIGSARAEEGTDTPPVIVRTTSRPDQTAIIGQHVRVFVDVLFRDGMAHPPRVALPAMDAAQIFRFETQATSLSDGIRGRTYVGQRFEFALYARRGGTLTIPAANVVLLDRDGHETGVVSGTALTLSVTVPLGVDPSQAATASTRLSAHETWAPAPDAAYKAGDALVRTITREVADVPGSALPDIRFSAPNGVRVYGEPARIDDRIERGALTGERTDRATYVFETAGRFDLPAVSQTWWDLESDRLRTVTFPAVRVTVAAPPPSAMPSGGSSAAGPERVWMLAVVFGGAALLIAAIVWTKARSRAIGKKRRRSREQSERTAFNALLQTCQGSDPRIIYAALVHWRDQLPAYDRLVGQAGGASLMFATADLERSLFGGANAAHPWSVQESRSLAKALQALRTDLLQPRSSPAFSILPALNPAHHSSS
ncbi:BatD family protein [Azospirillum tabaci]|uniref:BatD family protein n=1 Tax=Azospirillum tabaci TaxID=2752310 RepID=UPI001660BF50|nr:BatD family protein [Azospirillum tabaci]